MNGNYTVLDQSPSIIAAYGVDVEVTVSNTGSTVVFLSDERNVTESIGYPLNVGASRVWQADMPLFAIAKPGETAQLNVSRGSGAITDPSAIASQIIDQGLAEDIAAAITVSGVPTIDEPTVIFNIPLTGVGGGLPYTTGPIDITRYQSIYIRAQYMRTSGGDAFALPVKFEATFSGVGLQGVVYSAVGAATSGGDRVTAAFLLPAALATLAINLSFNGVNVYGLDTVQITVTGSYRNVSDPLITITSGSAGGGTNVWSQPPGATVTSSSFLETAPLVWTFTRSSLAISGGWRDVLPISIVGKRIGVRFVTQALAAAVPVTWFTVPAGGSVAAVTGLVVTVLPAGATSTYVEVPIPAGVMFGFSFANASGAILTNPSITVFYLDPLPRLQLT